MTTCILDLLFVATFAVAGPMVDHFVFWPAVRRRSQIDPARARRWLWIYTSVHGWSLVAVGSALWIASSRSAPFGFAIPHGWRLWTCIGVVLVFAAYQALAIATVARSPEARASVRQQAEGLAALLPHTRTEMVRFGGVALTAGFCEEFLYRGFLVGVFAPWIGWWGAAALSLPFFAIAHVAVYQGWHGALRTGLAGVFYTVVFALFDSLWPAIALHVLVDLGAGVMAWLSLREEARSGG
jgi:uncharacterized protein